MTPAVLMLQALVRVDPGGSILVNFPAVSEKPCCTPSVSVYQPTIVPASLIPYARVSVALGTSIFLKAPAVKLKPWPRPLLSRKNPTITLVVLISLQSVSVAPGALMVLKVSVAWACDGTAIKLAERMRVRQTTSNWVVERVDISMASMGNFSRRNRMKCCACCQGLFCEKPR